jgi:aldehyde:ferredoxin oxidoreductase
VTGVPYATGDLIKVGERTYNLERLYNLREGFTRADDTLPLRLLNEAVPAGPSQGWVNKLEPMLIEYYRARGWDQNGVPLSRKLADLHLADLMVTA